MPGSSSTCAVAQPLRMRDSIHVARCECAILCELQCALGSSATVSIQKAQHRTHRTLGRGVASIWLYGLEPPLCLPKWGWAQLGPVPSLDS